MDDKKALIEKEPTERNHFQQLSTHNMPPDDKEITRRSFSIS